MGICRLDIPVARRDFTATLAAPLPYYATLVVLFNTTVAAFLCSQETLLLGQPSPGIGFCLTRQPSASPIVCFINKGGSCAYEEFDADFAPNLSTPGRHIKILERTALEKQDHVEQDQRY